MISADNNAPVSEEVKLLAANIVYAETDEQSARLLFDALRKEGGRVLELACTHGCKKRGFDEHVYNCKSAEIIRALAAKGASHE